MAARCKPFERVESTRGRAGCCQVASVRDPLLRLAASAVKRWSELTIWWLTQLQLGWSRGAAGNGEAGALPVMVQHAGWAESLLPNAVMNYGHRLPVPSPNQRRWCRRMGMKANFASISSEQAALWFPRPMAPSGCRLTVMGVPRWAGRNRVVGLRRPAVSQQRCW
jgi:hypothetical protein